MKISIDYTPIVRIARGFLVAITLVFALTWAAFAANINATNKYAWSETTGWLNFLPTYGGVTVNPTYLSGTVWHERIGWLQLGASAGGPYGNSTATNWGVNQDVSGNLSGYAWSETLGWINFSPTHGGVNINLLTGAFSGYAWAERFGWINFNNSSPAYYVSYASFPGAPTGVSATAGNGQATVTFTAPASNGGSPITGYTVTSNPGNITASGSGSPITVIGLTNGSTYTFTVTASNAVGPGPISQPPSNSVMPLGTPGAPTGVSATAGNGQATITFTAPASNGGSPITGYTVTSNPGNIAASGSGSPITVIGLTNGSTYTFTVTASNAVGPGPSSQPPSNSVTPTTPGNTINGSCGTSNNVYFFLTPASNLCSSGNASNVSSNVSWNWTCNGSNGGSTASCSAPKIISPSTSMVSATPLTFNFTGMKSGNTFTVYQSTGGGSPFAVTSSSSTTYTIPATLLPNTIYKYSVTSDIDSTQTIIMTIRTQLYNGWNIVAVPYKTTDVNPATFFESPVSAIYQWIPSGATSESSDSVLGSYTTVSSLVQGNGYFVKASNNSTLLAYSGTAGPTTVTITLMPGWTMIANPNTTNKTNIGTAWVVDANTSPTSLSDAINSGTIGSSLYWWNGSTYDFWTVASNPQVEPWKAYWILNLDKKLSHTLTIQ